MRIAFKLLAVVLMVSVTLYAEGNSWNHVRYNGGTLQTKVDPKDWDNHLTITSDLITFNLKDGQKVDIDPKSVTGLSYGQEAHRRVGTMIALGIIISPLALFGLMHKTRMHFIGIEYKTADGKGAGLLLQGHKDNYRAILTSLEAVTGAPLAVAEKDREFVPGINNTRVVSNAEAKAQTESAAAGNVVVASTPDAADIYLDGNFKGNAPSTLKVPAGKHTIKVTLAGYQDWTREIDVSAGSDVKLTATLTK